jgi:hypothetical protein
VTDTQNSALLRTEEDVRASASCLRVEAGALIAGRYRLRRQLGQGGHGEVWEGDDNLASTVVAIKLLLSGSGAEPARVRREVSALRLLRLPGVVRLLDEGTDDDRPFLVMELVPGDPFPGAGIPRAWPAIARATVALLETMGRIHAAGVVHRDLKPANVLVGADGLPVVLDFGLSSGRRLGDGLTQEGTILGTPAYLAPEQILGESVAPAADLYALGVMLYEALAGRLPHEARGLQELIMARLVRRPRPLRELSPEVPPVIAGVVDLLLSRAPEDRPRSAGEVLAMLHGQPIANLAGPPLPRLGGDAPLEALLAAARSHRSLDLVGPSGSGRSRLLHEVAEALQREGRRVAWAPPGRRMFASVEALVGALAEHSDRRLHEVRALVDERITAMIADGTTVIADDAERLDPESAAALDRCRGAGAILRARLAAAPAREGSVELEPVDEATLKPLFAGPDRFFHLQTDAARILWTRTEGLQARIAEEVTAWLRAGLARWDGALLSVDRDALDRLAAGLRVVAGAHAGASLKSSGLAPHLEELCAWVAVAWPSTDPALIGRAMALPVWRVEADLEELARRGVVRILADGRVELRTAAPADDGWSPDRRRAAHRAIARALPEGAEGRLLHLLAGEDDAATADVDEIAREADVLARRIAQDGYLGRATTALAQALFAVRRAPLPEDTSRSASEERLLATWVQVALEDATPQAMDRVLYELCRTRPRTPRTAQLEELVRAALAFGVGGERASELASAMAPFSDPELERRRQGIRVLAARRGSQRLEERVLVELTGWAESSTEAQTRARFAGWLGRLRYRQGRFEEAARLHGEAADWETWGAARIAARLNAASALMEAFRHEEAAAWAEAAREQARACRHAFFEARAEWLLRSTAYRSGRALEPDRELVNAVALLGMRDFEATTYLTEAAIAYRAGDLLCAADIADRAARIWTSIGDTGPAMLARSFALACGSARGAADEIDALAERARACATPGLGIQALAFLTLTEGSARPDWQAAALPLLAGIAPPHFQMRMDVLSARESLDLLGTAPITAPSSRTEPGCR